MLPSVVSREIVQALRSQLRSQFPSTTAGFRRNGDTKGSLIDDLTRQSGAVIKGPYLSFGLPFQTAATDEPPPFAHIDMPDAPYVHQFKAYQRLTGPHPQPTLVATGTGSGKTECFMYPILEHCAEHRGPSVKAIIVYPMNALAQDQARRFASEIFDRESLRGHIRVGLFTGDSETTRLKAMTSDSVITCKATQREQPPDILLTNYKMLDYLLIRPRDRALWRFNEPDTLRYLVVDELHTFDGAQGTDLACLIRRLKDRLEVGERLACVGTSATVGDETDRLVDYASKVFDRPFTPDCVLREERVAPAAFLPLATSERWPDEDALVRFRETSAAGHEGYIEAAQALWLEPPVSGLFDEDSAQALAARNKLGERLKALAPFQDLLERHTEVADVTPLVQDWSLRLRVEPDLAALAVESLAALASIARSGKQPFVTLRAQLWLRELRRIVASVGPRPELCFSDDLSPEAQKSLLHLPVLHCNQCHAMGWVSARHPAKAELVRDLGTIYNSFFGGDSDTCVIYPADDGPPDRKHERLELCNACGARNSQQAERCVRCDATAERLIPVIVPDMNRQHQQDGAQIRRFHRDCPWCESRESLLILGSRAPTLSSVAIHRIFNSEHNDDPKLIAFSDSVQDAAHRAGFFEARTYTQVVRHALAMTIASGSHNSLAALIDGFGTAWRDLYRSHGRRDEDFVGTFIAPDLEWLRDWETLQTEGALPKRSNLIERWILPRLRWEVLSEFGLRSRLGRTLERSGAAIVYPSRNGLEHAVASILPALREHIAELRDVTADSLRGFLLGVLWRLRTRGGFYDDDLEDYLKRGGDVYQLRRRQFLPTFGRQTAAPTFLTLARQKGTRFDHAVGNDAPGWYRNWFNKSLGAGNPLASASIVEAYLIVLSRLASETGLLNVHRLSRHGEEYSVWSLNSARWRLSADVVTLVCERCRNRAQVAAVELADWSGAPCLRSQCSGRMNAEDAPGTVDERVRQPTAERPPVRLITAEHTAVLDASVREQVERSFKATPGETWDVNLLSATPTMEMGVDIGALSSVLLCSVPPAQANYLQRIGRAGRKDGNAFNLTIANGVPHDLYFYAEPLEMMRGAVQPPGVFLGAIAVLERQLVAYCFDQWVKSGIDDDAIPSRLGQVLNNVERNDPDKFPRNFLAFVDSERGRISRDFINLFPKLPSQGIDQLQQFLYGAYQGRPGITYRASNLLQEKLQQRINLRSDIDQLKREIERLQRQPQDESTEAAIADMQSERNGLMRLVRRMNDQYTFNFLTDEGLLPNYAFPEEGVKLSSIIYRRRELEQRHEGESPYERIEFEIRRPAHAALRELAPFSRFYGNSRHVEIDQVEIRSSAPEEWRLCNRCNYAESLVTGDDHGACPRCGSPGWINASQKQTLLRLKEVYAFASDRDSRIGDDSDDREPVYFRRQYLFDLEDQRAQFAHRIDDPIWPFGFEYRPSATLREINFGKEIAAGPSFEVAGVPANRAGFTVCKHCGKVRKFRRRVEDNHTRRCPVRAKPKDEQLEESYPELYLYRELRSEALRILLPFAEVAQSPVRLQSFVAALYLGLKIHFHGDVNHLQITHYSEPVGASDLRRQYLAIMDTVPGGTGYLRELVSAPEKFEHMLRAAYETLVGCECQHDSAKDGCYRCLYAYRDNYRLPDTSRRSALETLSNVLERWDRLTPLGDDETLDHTEVNALFDSELERLFIEVLANTRGCSLATQHVNGKPGYVLAVQREDNERVTRWSIEPQVAIGPREGVPVSSQCDFLLRCLSEGENVLPIALFLDGFEFHAKIADEDTAKRFSLLRSGRYRAWSLSWTDLPRSGHTPPASLMSWLDQPRHRGGVRLYDGLATRLRWPSFAQQSDLAARGGFRLLLDVLATPADVVASLRQFAISRFFGLIDQEATRDPDDTLQRVGAWLPVPWHERYWQPPVLLGDTDLDSLGLAKAAASLPHQAFNDGTFADHTALCLRLDDREPDSEAYKAAWHGFWAATNVFQVLAHYLPVSVKGIEEGLYAEIIDTTQAAENAQDAASSAAWREAYELTTLEDELRALEALGVPAPEIGVDVQGSDGVVLGSLEWAWPARSVGFTEVAEQAAALERAGWTIFTDPTPAGLDALAAALAEQEAS